MTSNAVRVLSNAPSVQQSRETLIHITHILLYTDFTQTQDHIVETTVVIYTTFPSGCCYVITPVTCASKYSDNCDVYISFLICHAIYIHDYA